MQATPILKRIDGAKITFIRIPAKKYAANIFFCVLFISKLKNSINSP